MQSTKVSKSTVCSICIMSAMMLVWISSASASCKLQEISGFCQAGVENKSCMSKLIRVVWSKLNKKKFKFWNGFNLGNPLNVAKFKLAMQTLRHFMMPI